MFWFFFILESQLSTSPGSGTRSCECRKNILDEWAITFDPTKFLNLLKKSLTALLSSFQIISHLIGNLYAINNFAIWVDYWIWTRMLSNEEWNQNYEYFYTMEFTVTGPIFSIEYTVSCVRDTRVMPNGVGDLVQCHARLYRAMLRILIAGTTNSCED